MTSLVSCHTQGSAEDGVGSPSFRAPLPCEKRKPKYTSCVPKSTLSLNHYARRKHLLWLRLRSYLLLCNVKIKELVPPRLLSARQTPSFLSRRHTQRNRSTRTRAGTRPQPTNKERKQDVPVWLLFQVP